MTPKPTEELTGLEVLKLDYEKIREKHKLPSFEQLNENFEIEKIGDRETETLLKIIRQLIAEKIYSYIRFIEIFMNPGNAPMLFLSMAKHLTSEDKRILQQLYTELGRVELDFISLDNRYNEEKEAKAVRKICGEWSFVQDRFEKVIDSMKKALDKKSEKGKQDYLG